MFCVGRYRRRHLGTTSSEQLGLLSRVFEVNHVRSSRLDRNSIWSPVKVVNDFPGTRVPFRKMLHMGLDGPTASTIFAAIVTLTGKTWFGIVGWMPLT
jgi:hypothetical protein